MVSNVSDKAVVFFLGPSPFVMMSFVAARRFSHLFSHTAQKEEYNINATNSDGERRDTWTGIAPIPKGEEEIHGRESHYIARSAFISVIYFDLCENIFIWQDLISTGY